MAVILASTSPSLLGRIVFFHRRQAGLGRNELADIAGVGKTLIYNIENGKTNLRLDTLLRVLSALNITVGLQSPLMALFEKQDHEIG